MIDLRYAGKDIRHHEEVSSNLEKTTLKETHGVMVEEVVTNTTKSNGTHEVVVGGKAKKSHLTYHQGVFRLCWAIKNESVHFTFTTNVTGLGSNNIYSSIAFSTDKTQVIYRLIV